MRVLLIVFFAGLIFGQSPKLPPDIDPQSNSRLPLIHRDQLNDDEKKVFDDVANTAPGSGSNSQLNSNPTNSKLEKPVARMKPYFGWPIASLIAPMANGPTTADRQVKKRITPAMAPCSDLGKQLIPFGI